ncbi:MAG TPA: hypothetical protein VMK12_02015 [Anaeromyxobacteraceae bacterium]|nr:hypothetical protein [Anaeromyxobacteraceae bacterium]
MRIVIAIVLLAHGVAHLVGFVVPWRLATLPDVPYRSTILGGRIEVGDIGVKALGVLWLIAALAFAAAGAEVLWHASSWRSHVIVAATASLALCIAGWPDARIGVAVNVALIAMLALGARAGWLARLCQ